MPAPLDKEPRKGGLARRWHRTRGGGKRKSRAGGDWRTRWREGRSGERESNRDLGGRRRRIGQVPDRDKDQHGVFHWHLVVPTVRKGLSNGLGLAGMQCGLREALCQKTFVLVCVCEAV